MAKRFRIHPAMGIARVGDAPEDFFIGPEHPEIPSNWENGQFQSFRDAAGRIKRQAARFRIFEYDEDEQGRLTSPREVTIGPEVTKIEWRVHVANKKASFFAFYGQHGADDLYLKRSQTPASEIIEGTDPPRANLRNAGAPTTQRQSLFELDPGERIISTANPSSVVLKHNNAGVPFIKDLGELRLDGARLVFLGGHGDSGSNGQPPVRINEYANNDTWFDDMSDGSVKARVFLADNTILDADPAWVSVGPPDFAPGIGNVVTLYDTIWDLSIRGLPSPVKSNAEFETGLLKRFSEQKQLWQTTGSLAGYRPSYVDEIYPILSRAFGAFWVFSANESNQGFHISTANFQKCAIPDKAQDGDIARDLRQVIFLRLRDPDSQELNWQGMPRGLGDLYNEIDEDKRTAVARSFFSLTRVQYALMKEWANGNFDPTGWTGDEPEIPASTDTLSPQELDRAALTNAVGGPFYPGIDVSWIVRSTELYSEPFRLNAARKPETEPGGFSELKLGALQFGPGFFSQQMALPWQADFYDCHKERIPGPDGTYTFMWWTAHRPDNVLPFTATVPSEERVRWVRDMDSASETDDPDDQDNLARFEQMQQNWKSKLRFVVGDRRLFKEER